MSLTFYRAPHSTASITELVFEELGVPHEIVTLDIQKGETKKPEFTKLNPVDEATRILELASDSPVSVT